MEEELLLILLLLLLLLSKNDDDEGNLDWLFKTVYVFEFAFVVGLCDKESESRSLEKLDLNSVSIGMFTLLLELKLELKFAGLTVVAFLGNLYWLVDNNKLLLLFDVSVDCFELFVEEIIW